MTLTLLRAKLIFGWIYLDSILIPVISDDTEDGKRVLIMNVEL